jgi:membrane protease YdiL (CAAX protease family)
MNTVASPVDMKSPVDKGTDRVSRSQFHSLNAWFTLALCMGALVLPLVFGKPGVWTALEPTELLSWHTALSAALGFSVGAVIGFLVIHWSPLHVVADHMANSVAWETLGIRDVLFIALLAAFGEELLFRGALQPLIGLVPAALVFGLLHATSLPHIILAGILGLWMGLLFYWTGDLWPPIAAHFALDTATSLLLTQQLRAGRRPAQGV